MRKMTRRLQALGDKASQIQQAIASVPPRIMDLRESIVSTAGQLQQLRAEVQGAVTGLRTDTEDRLLEALQELDAGGETLRRAGFELTGVDLDLGPNRRLTAHVIWVQDVSEATMRSVLAACVGQSALHALLSALVQAGRVADGVKLDTLGCDGFVVHVGAAPVVRICWRTEESAKAAAPERAPAVAATAANPAPASEAAPAVSAFTSTTFFEPRPIAGGPIRVAPPAAALATVPSGAGAVPAIPASEMVPVPRKVETAGPPASGDWQRIALDRFKRMPDLSGRRR